jgi:hypothetical protein
VRWRSSSAIAKLIPVISLVDHALFLNHDRCLSVFFLENQGSTPVPFQTKRNRTVKTIQQLNKA